MRYAGTQTVYTRHRGHFWLAHDQAPNQLRQGAIKIRLYVGRTGTTLALRQRRANQSIKIGAVGSQGWNAGLNAIIATTGRTGGQAIAIAGVDHINVGGTYLATGGREGRGGLCGTCRR